MWKTLDRSVFQLLRDLYCIFKPKSLTLVGILAHDRISFNQTFSRPKFCVESISAALLPQKILIFLWFDFFCWKKGTFLTVPCGFTAVLSEIKITVFVYSGFGEKNGYFTFSHNSTNSRQIHFSFTCIFGKVKKCPFKMTVPWKRNALWVTGYVTLSDVKWQCTI